MARATFVDWALCRGGETEEEDGECRSLETGTRSHTLFGLLPPPLSHH